MKLQIICALLMMSSYANAQNCPKPSTCLSEYEKQALQLAIDELKSIHRSPATLKLDKPVEIIIDWNNSVYVNGGIGNPIKATLTIGDHITREMQMEIPTEIYFRPKPPDPMFRLRYRAQFGILPLEIVENDSFWDAGISVDFFHVNKLNTSVYVGVKSVGGGVGYDLTKNFGPYVGYSMTYSDLSSGVLTGIYFSFN